MRVVLPDRDRGTNTIDGVRLLVERWGDPAHPANRVSPQVHRSPHGNLNSSGELAAYRSPLLAMCQQGFLDTVESGVRALVATLTGRCGWITYSSCEGHVYAGTVIAPVEREVGLLPRSLDEEARIVRALEPPIAQTNADHGPPVVRLFRSSIWDPLERRCFDAVDLVFARAAMPWDEYFARLPRVSDSLTDALAI